ncbi:hypothetical protein OG689_35370 [Kitasatospora sp. NBC_00240]|uniref:hypothetical protein n=1 Tax=Kitasatospora sp. NBC_00240 TaxID=2903567 RepID=UPI002255EB49|nr:hypothetical protein [Kitasatospora sp. NBC_00240]MCX5214480.1 hypothetical protein [Kitasatospora sp. NBC_00240]
MSEARTVGAGQERRAVDGRPETSWRERRVLDLYRAAALAFALRTAPGTRAGDDRPAGDDGRRDVMARMLSSPRTEKEPGLPWSFLMIAVVRSTEYRSHHAPGGGAESTDGLVYALLSVSRPCRSVVLERMLAPGGGEVPVCPPGETGQGQAMAGARQFDAYVTAHFLRAAGGACRCLDAVVGHATGRRDGAPHPLPCPGPGRHSARLSASDAPPSTPVLGSGTPADGGPSQTAVPTSGHGCPTPEGSPSPQEGSPTTTTDTPGPRRPHRSWWPFFSRVSRDQ